MTSPYRDRTLAFTAASATRTGEHSFGINDDRALVDPARSLFLVADGTGPTYGGYYAPIGMEVAIDIIRDALEHLGDAANPVDGSARLRAAFVAAHERCAALAQEQHTISEAERPRHGGDHLRASLAASREVTARCGRPVQSFAHFAASITAIHAWGNDRITIAQIGVCRAYRLRRGILEQLLPDHTLGSALAATGEAIPPGAPWFYRFIATRLLGMPQGSDPSMRTEHVEPGDRYLLCTDGVWGYLDVAEIDAALGSDAAPEVVAAALVDRIAHRAESRPHATAVVIDVAGGSPPR